MQRKKGTKPPRSPESSVERKSTNPKKVKRKQDEELKSNMFSEDVRYSKVPNLKY